MTVEQIKRLIEDGREHEFYAGYDWQRMADKVRRYDKRECQQCKSRGRYRRGVIVHHVKHLRDRPDLAMLLFDPDTRERQLITLCKQCHEAEHPEALAAPEITKERYKTEERWD